MSRPDEVSLGWVDDSATCVIPFNGEFVIPYDYSNDKRAISLNSSKIVRIGNIYALNTSSSNNGSSADVTSLFALKNMASYTIAFWIRVPSDVSNVPFVIDAFCGNYRPWYGIQIGINASSQSYFAFWDTNNTDEHNGDYTFSANNWYHIGVTFSGSTHIMYINGNIIVSASGVVSGMDFTLTPAQFHSVGGDHRDGSRNLLNGYVANFLFATRAYNSIDIRCLYESERINF